MNYKELWEQARALAFEEPVDMDGPLEGLKGFNQQVYEKFAELIVQECSHQVMSTVLLEGDSVTEILMHASFQLKQHFGVEL